MASNERAAPPLDSPVPHVSPVNASRELLELERQIRSACIQTATVLEVNEMGPHKLVVKYVARTEAAARDAATAISQMPSLRPFTVDFEVRLAGQ